MSDDLTPEAVEAEAAEFEKCADLSFFRSNDDYRRTAATLRALSARVVELESLVRGQEEQLEIQGNALIRVNSRNDALSVERNDLLHDLERLKDSEADAINRAYAVEAALATARADALREAAKWCNDEAERCDDASRWGGSRKYVADCKAAAYALHNARHKIEALIPQEKPHE